MRCGPAAFTPCALWVRSTQNPAKRHRVALATALAPDYALPAQTGARIPGRHSVRKAYFPHTAAPWPHVGQMVPLLRTYRYQNHRVGVLQRR